MLIRFGCSNYKSIFSYQELIFTASSLKDAQSDLINNIGIPEHILPSIALYGANASGKTNMIEALHFFVRFIRSSYREAAPNGINRPTFKLSPDAVNQVSEFDMDFILDNKHYHYGYKINDEIVMEEWLFSYAYENRKSRTVLFHRSIEEATEYKFSKYLKGENRIIAKLTRANSLYLSSAAQNNHDLLSGIYDYFRLNFSYRFDQLLQSPIIASRLKEYGTIDQVSSFLKNSGTGIEAIELKVKERDGDELKILNKFQEVFKDTLGDTSKNVHFKDVDAIELAHKDQSGNLIPFDLEDESLGTRAMIALLAPVFKVLNTGGVFVVDEIESSLHVLLTLQVVKLFSRKETNPKGAQLVFTTHETNILCNNILRRDQIWFSEKSFDGETIIAPLTDYELRATDNFQKGYLEGRFGAIPFLGDIQKLFQIENNGNG
ncbi:MAG: ATP-binding protein [Methylobacter sp.]|nr:ATP-binding protein [Methylobacter sp.]